MTTDVLRPITVAAAPSFQFSIDVFEGGDLDRADWPSIADASNVLMHVYQSREFLDVWMNTVGDAHRARSFLVVVKHREHGPIFYLPLVVEKKFNIRLLRFMDAGVADFNAPIVVPGAELARQEFTAVWPMILSRLPKVDAIDLQKISANVAGIPNPLTYLDCAPHGTSGHAITLSAISSNLNAPTSVARLRKKLRRDFRRLSQLGETTFLINPSPAEADEIFTTLIKFKRQKYMATTGHDFLAMPGIRRFYREMAAPQHIGGLSHISALTCGGKVVSAHLGFTGHGCFYYTFPAYDPAYRQYSVGHLLLQHLIDQCRADEYETFDLGEGDAPYKAKLATHELPLSDYEHALNAAGLLYLQMRHARRSLAPAITVDAQTVESDGARVSNPIDLPRQSIAQRKASRQ
ncbi:MAG TPA: GNAT family N-acetyltransferase [Xanthobacteraceae bacterium]|nr:GNAT family N-acetyltransferase [Xanthobacteraceae bacterium]